MNTAPTAEKARKDDELIARYKRELDLTSIDENLRVTPTQRFEKFVSFMALIEGLRVAGRKLRHET